MSDDNKDLIGRIAHRGAVPSWELPTQPIPVTTGDLTAPIDETQADAMTTTQIVRGWISDAKERAATWEPRPMGEEP